MLLLCLPCLISFEQLLHKTHIVIGLARVEFGIHQKAACGNLQQSEWGSLTWAKPWSAVATLHSHLVNGIVPHDSCSAWVHSLLLLPYLLWRTNTWTHHLRLLHLLLWQSRSGGVLGMHHLKPSCVNSHWTHHCVHLHWSIHCLHDSWTLDQRLGNWSEGWPAFHDGGWGWCVRRSPLNGGGDLWEGV